MRARKVHPKKKRKYKKSKSCGSKVKHRTEEGAKIHIKNIYRKNQTYHNMKAYKCKFCGFWHVAHDRTINEKQFNKMILGGNDNHGPFRHLSGNR